MQAGDLLKNLDTGEERFRVESLLVEGRSYYIAEGADTHLDEMRVILKAIRYTDDPSRQEIADRREAIEVELEALTTPSVLLPEPIDFFHVASDIGDGREPVLALEYQYGKTLTREVARTSGGLEPSRALKIVHEIALALKELHDRRFVFRDLSPEHVLLGLDDMIHLVGTGNIARMKERPSAFKPGINKRFSAPEIRQERSGKLLKPVADIYGLGALLSFLLTGKEPTSRIESPLTEEAYEKLQSLPEGYRLLVSRCMQPMAKKRFGNAKKILPYLAPDNLPTSQTEGFTQFELMPPFEPDAMPPQANRATRSKISSGPLISIPSEEEAGGAPAPDREQPPGGGEDGEMVPAETSRETSLVVRIRSWFEGCLPLLLVPVLGAVAALLWLVV